MINKEIIKIEQENKTEAEFMSRNFIDKVTKNRAYVNALGSELVIKYLVENGVEIGELHNIHSISKVLEKVDISDILLSNIHIDVRIVFDEDNIFVPKSHFDLDIKPDIYVFAKLHPSFGSVELLGYLESTKINTDKSNEEYYFVEKEDLESVSTLVNYVKNFNRSREKSLSEDEILKGRELSVAMADHDISDKDFKKLLSMLLVSDSLRNSLIEFDNFELLSYNAVAFIPTEAPTETALEEKTVEEPALEETVGAEDTSSEESVPEEVSEEFLDTISDESALVADEEESITEIPETVAEQVEELETEDDLPIVEDSSLMDEKVEATDISEDSDAISAFEEDFQTFGEEEKINEISDIIDEEIVSEPLTEDIFDGDIFSEDIATSSDSAISSNSELPISDSKDSGNSRNSNIGGAIASGAAAIAGAAGAAGAIGAAGTAAAASTTGAIGAAGASAIAGTAGAIAGAGEALASGAAEAIGIGESAATDEAIKLAGMADGVSEKVSDNIENISEDLPDISFDNSNVEISEEVFDADDTIAGISNDFDNGVDGIDLPELVEDNIGGVELPESSENSDNTYDDIFADFAQDSDTNSQADAVSAAPSSENMMSFADLEQMGQAPISSASEADFSDFDISEGTISNSLVSENSTVISDKTFSVGEIPIDINRSSMNQEPMQEELEDIYNPDYSSNNSSMLNNNVRIIKNNPEQNKKNPLMVIIIALALLAAMGFAAFKFMKPAENNEPIVDDYVPESAPDVVPDDPNALSVDKNNVVDMDQAALAPANTGAGIIRQTKPISATAYLKVSKISWEVPDYVSYSPAFRQYFQSAGRSLKLALTSDLLLASEYPYSNQVRVSATFNRGGAFQNARLVQSSGSAEIDRIVLQTVNQTLKVLNAPASLRDDENTTAILKIYF